MASTYEPIATTTLSSNGSISFTSIPGTYTDLRVVLTALGSTNGATPYLRFNTDTGTNYSSTCIYGDGTSAGSNAYTSANSIYNFSFGMRTATPFMYTFDIFSYAGSTYKTALGTYNEDNNGSGYSTRLVGLWRSTSAITTVGLSASTGSFAAGTTATLYGIKAA